MASATSKKTELKLTGVARASLEELLLDYEDHLRQRGLRIWHKDSPEAVEVRKRYLSARSGQSDQSDRSDSSDPYEISTAPPGSANTLICLINQTSFLLHRRCRSSDRHSWKRGLHGTAVSRAKRREGGRKR